MTDPYRIPDTPRRHHPQAGPLRTVLWLVLALSMIGNAVAPGEGSIAAHLAFGTVTVLCVVGLAVRYVRSR